MHNSYIAEGAYGCVYRKPLKCKSDKDAVGFGNGQAKAKGKARAKAANAASKADDSVTKIFIDKKGFDKEIAASQDVAAIDPTGANLLIPSKACEIKPTDFAKIDQAHMCKHLADRPLPAHMYQLIMPYGGIRIDHYFKQRISVALVEALVILEPLMKALLLLHKQRICHNDIKCSNVLVTPQGKAILIDHSLMRPYDKIYADDRIHRSHHPYFSYPPEYYIVYNVVSKTPSRCRHDVLESAQSFGTTLYSSYAKFVSVAKLHKGVNATLALVERLARPGGGDGDASKTLSRAMTKYAHLVDVYSVGTVLVALAPYISVPKTNQKGFKDLVQSMLDADISKRYDAKQAYAAFSALR